MRKKGDSRKWKEKTNLITHKSYLYTFLCNQFKPEIYLNTKNIIVFKYCIMFNKLETILIRPLTMWFGPNSTLQNQLVGWGLPPTYSLIIHSILALCLTDVGLGFFPNTPPSCLTLLGLVHGQYSRWPISGSKIDSGSIIKCGFWYQSCVILFRHTFSTP